MSRDVEYQWIPELAEAAKYAQVRSSSNVGALVTVHLMGDAHGTAMAMRAVLVCACRECLEANCNVPGTPCSVCEAKKCDAIIAGEWPELEPLLPVCDLVAPPAP